MIDSEVGRLVEYQLTSEDFQSDTWHPAYSHGIFQDSMVDDIGNVMPHPVIVIEDSITGELIKTEPQCVRFCDIPSWMEKHKKSALNELDREEE